MDQAGSQDRLRIDKWLWHARVTKTRSLAARLVADGHVRLNGTRTDTPAKAVKPGDVLTIALEHTVRVYRILALGERRGPASEAQGLYEDLSPDPPGKSKAMPDMG
ncbi:RNA-binding S4 domain-containing protein [Labrys sp. KNU-23]|uniref:RNA-binding S4 domain-containing protein n=1 Tax=Labrys sp. KNU-23 TaxID=2789216 RepID=UPI0011EEFE9A|nr:RNA-binding S4 domain-containing protein [Labrys sp. KNU-23]QEN89495.1 RNA-binding S4 domain-containing protein [Labrys sp. KNU-23]